MYNKMYNEELENKILSDISEKRIWEHVKFFNTLVRKSGSPEDFEAVDYIVNYLKSAGVSVRVHEFTSLISYPIYANLECISDDEERKTIPCKTRAFSATTPKGGLVGELIYVKTAVPGSGVTDGLVDNMAAGDEFAGLDVRGKIVLTERGGPDSIMYAEKHGALGLIHLWSSPEDAIHEMIATPVWGTPVPETAHLIPNIPVIAIKNEDGLFLKKLCQEKKVSVRIETLTDTKWRRLKLPVATIEGYEEPDKFVLVGGHLDSWHVGITDNATGNASCIEMAKVLTENRDKLKRSVRIAWWPGHSYGRYSGSTWFSDNFWMDINKNCLAYINVDSPGCKGATDYSLLTGMAETKELIQGVVSKAIGQIPEIERPTRCADQSFWGQGVSSLYLLLSYLPPEKRADVGGSAGGWWWHTEYDTIDKADSELLHQDTLIYTLSILRLVNSPILPLRLTGIADEIASTLRQYNDMSKDHLDLGIVNELSVNLLKLAKEFDSDVSKHISNGDYGNAKEINQNILNVLRNLIPATFTTNGLFYQDLAIPRPAIPGLYDILNLKQIESNKDIYGFTLTKLVRERNRLAYALENSIKILNHHLNRR